MLVFSIIFSLLDILVIFFALYMLILIKCNKKIKEENILENLGQIDQNEKLMINNTISSFDQ